MGEWVIQGLIITWCAWVVVVSIGSWVIFYEVKEMKKSIAAMESELKHFRGVATLKKILTKKIDEHIKHENGEQASR